MFLITLFASLLFAQSTESTNVKNIEFEPTDVNASTNGPNGGIVHVVKRPILSPMIQLRNDFHIEMMASTSQID